MSLHKQAYALNVRDTSGCKFLLDIVVVQNVGSYHVAAIR